MVNNEVKLALSLKNNPGSFALFLGSGVSTEAGIPTGCGVMEDLIIQISDLQENEFEDDPFDWYEEEFGKAPRYDDLMGSVGGTREERRSLLEKYFEPTPYERKQGLKLPTEAHRSIGWLVEQGYVDIIITTNFDRLLERGFSDLNATPLVITSDEDAEREERVVHEDAVIVKPNGDYKEVNIKNLADELEEYSQNMESLLRRIFSEYGIIVCGWSARYDTALKQIFKNAEESPYSTFWANHGTLEEDAKELINHLNAAQIQIDGAANFFFQLKENVRAIEDSGSGGPLS